MAQSTFVKSINGRAVQDSESIHELSTNGTTITYTKGDGSTGTITTQDTDTHYTTGLITGASATATINAAATNGNVYLNLKDDSTIRNSHNIVGSGATIVTCDANGKITISSTDNNTDTKVTQTAVTASEYSDYRSLVWSACNSATKDFTPTSTTDVTYVSSNLYVQPSTGSIFATKFVTSSGLEIY